jgi:hypothetical protein
MPSDSEREATVLVQIEADLAELAAHVDTWLQDRFLTSESVAGLNLEDLTGLIVWLRQWQDNFESYREEASGSPAVNTRLDQVHAEIETSIATFKQMAEALPADQEN